MIEQRLRALFAVLPQTLVTRDSEFRWIVIKLHDQSSIDTLKNSLYRRSTWKAVSPIQNEPSLHSLLTLIWALP